MLPPFRDHGPGRIENALDAPAGLSHNTLMFRLLLPLVFAALAIAVAPAQGDEDAAVEASDFELLKSTWTLDIPMPGGVEHPLLKVRERGGKWKATLKGRRGTKKLENFRVEKGAFSFLQIIHTPRGELEMKFKGSVRGDQIQGVIELPMGILPFTGERGFR